MVRDNNDGSKEEHIDMVIIVCINQSEVL